MKHEVVLSVYMAVEADSDDEAFDIAEQVTEELFERDVQKLDEQPNIHVSNWFCDFAQA